MRVTAAVRVTPTNQVECHQATAAHACAAYVAEQACFYSASLASCCAHSKALLSGDKHSSTCRGTVTQPWTPGAAAVLCCMCDQLCVSLCNSHALLVHQPNTCCTAQASRGNIKQGHNRLQQHAVCSALACILQAVLRNQGTTRLSIT